MLSVKSFHVKEHNIQGRRARVSLSSLRWVGQNNSFCSLTPFTLFAHVYFVIETKQCAGDFLLQLQEGVAPPVKPTRCLISCQCPKLFSILLLMCSTRQLGFVKPMIIAQCVKGGGARKMLQTAKTFVTKLVRYIEWIVDPLWGHQFYLIWYCYGQKRPFFWPKPPFLAMRGSRRPRWLAKVDQMVDHSWTHVGGLT